jgi:hypothetical protein
VEPGLVIASAEGKQFLPRNTKMGSRGQSGRSGSGFAEAGECRAAGGEAGRWTEHSQEWLCHLQGRQRPYARGRGDEISSIKHYTAGVKRLSDLEQNPQVSDREPSRHLSYKKTAVRDPGEATSLRSPDTERRDDLSCKNTR